MRLLTHNTLRNNAADAKGKGFPLHLTATEMRVVETPNAAVADEEQQRQIAFVRGVLPTLDWDALVMATKQVGIPTLPPQLTDQLANDPEFLKALYNILMNVHVVSGKLKCPVTGREFVIENEIPNMILDEEDCENVRY